MRSALRWTSLAAVGGVLYALGERRLHLHDFNLFAGVLLALTALIVVIFVLTRDKKAE